MMGFAELLAAISKAARDVTRPELLWHALWPPLVAVLLWGVVAFSVWSQALAVAASIVPQLPWSGWEWISHWAAVFLALAAFAIASYMTALLLVAVIALPRMLDIVARRDYPDLGRHGENVFWGSLGTTLGAAAVFLVGGLLTLPLLLIPGVVLVLPFVWTTWLNQRTFRFDALADHATRAELTQIIQTQRAQFYAAAAVSALTAGIPVVQLLAPAFTALLFVHLGLAALRRQRREQGIEL
jgi:CysZ protein